MNADEALQLLYDECDHYTDAVVAVRDEVERLRNGRQRAVEAAARIDTAYSHGIPSGSDDPVTERDWRIVLDHARGAS